MATKEKMADDLIQEITMKINGNAEKTKGWGKAIKIVFTDIDIAYWAKLSLNGKVEAAEKGSPNQLQMKEAVATLEMSTETLQSVLKGSISPVKAFFSGAIKIHGSIEALMKLASAFGVG